MMNQYSLRQFLTTVIGVLQLPFKLGDAVGCWVVKCCIANWNWSRWSVVWLAATIATGVNMNRVQVSPVPGTFLLVVAPTYRV
jgi:hypothetical protein